MIPDPLRLGLEEPPGVLQQNPPPGQVTAERPIGEEAVEMPFEDHPVERLDHARDRLAMQIDETVHGCPVAVVHLIVRLEILALQVKSGPPRGNRLWLRPQAALWRFQW